jgi:glycosyltransferase involved in cell wall biosynthesis
MHEPLVSISCITFNHSLYIRNCLDGLINQRTNFDFEILIHDDASNDGTREIIEEYSLRNPNIKAICQNENQYSKGIRGIMARFNFPRARGKYIALCEGDDYWTDPFKLQKQVDFLEANPDYSLCFHPVSILMPDNELKEDFITKPPSDDIEIMQLAKHGNFIHTPSILFRNVVQVFPNSLLQSPIGDYCLQMVLAESGKFKMLHENMAVYRFGSGDWSSQDSFTRQLKTAKTHMILAGYFESRGNEPIMNILLERVLQFTYRNGKEIKREHLDFLMKDCFCIAALINVSIYRYENLSNRVNMLEQLRIENITTKELIQIAARRVVNKLKVRSSK